MRYLSLLLAVFMAWIPVCPAQTYQINNLQAGSVNNRFFPGQCSLTNKPTWCGAGTTPDAWVRAACLQIPTGTSTSPGRGIIDFIGMVGNWAATARPCANVNKQIVYIHDPTSLVTVTETDGDIALPLDNTSMFLGFGNGGCISNEGWQLGASANITAIVGPAHIDGTQEQFTVNGVCLYGNGTATVSEGMIYSQSNFANTTIDNNNVFACPIACVHIINSSSVSVTNDWLNANDGTTVTNRALWIQSLTLSTGTGCKAGNIHVEGGQIEHAYGGSPDIDVSGDGAGAIICGVRVDSVGVERNSASGSTTSINISDCWNCTVDHIFPSGTCCGTNLIGIAQTASGRTLNVQVGNIYAGGSFTNAINDSTPGGLVLTTAANPQVTKYVAQLGADTQSLYSAATNPLPTCSASLLGQQKLVSDATTPTYMGTYTSGGSVTAQTICSYNGSAYNWVTH